MTDGSTTLVFKVGRCQTMVDRTNKYACVDKPVATTMVSSFVERNDLEIVIRQELALMGHKRVPFSLYDNVQHEEYFLWTKDIVKDYFVALKSLVSKKKMQEPKFTLLDVDVPPPEPVQGRRSFWTMDRFSIFNDFCLTPETLLEESKFRQKYIKYRENNLS